MKHTKHHSPMTDGGGRAILAQGQRQGAKASPIRQTAVHPPALISRLLPKEQALFTGLSRREAEHFFEYLFSTPRRPDGIPRLRSQAVGLYDPFCDRRKYNLGILWQSAPYSNCAFSCHYCYSRSYLRHFSQGPRVKTNFRRAFVRCLARMTALELPPRHLSIANSTDVLQPLERDHRHTLFMLERIQECSGLFSSVAVLTKNPGCLLEDARYLKVMQTAGVELQVSIAFFRDSASTLVEPGAPPVSARRCAVEKLITSGVRVALRIDPLFQRGVPGCTEYQSYEEDLCPLVDWAVRAGVSYIIASPLKLGYRRNTVPRFNASLRPAFPTVKGGYRRMPTDSQQKLLNHLRQLCVQVGLPMECCFANILKRALHSARKSDAPTDRQRPTADHDTQEA